MSQLSCSVVKVSLVDYIESVLSPETGRKIKNHLVECGNCSQEYKELQSLLVTTKRIAVPDPGDQFWNEFPQKVLENVRAINQALSDPHSYVVDDDGVVQPRSAASKEREGDIGSQNHSQNIVPFAKHDNAHHTTMDGDEQDSVIQRMMAEFIDGNTEIAESSSSSGENYRQATEHSSNNRTAAGKLKVSSQRCLSSIVALAASIVLAIGGLLIIANNAHIDYNAAPILAHVYQQRHSLDSAVTQLAADIGGSQSANNMGFAGRAVRFNPYQAGWLYVSALTGVYEKQSVKAEQSLHELRKLIASHDVLSKTSALKVVLDSDSQFLHKSGLTQAEQMQSIEKLHSALLEEMDEAQSFAYRFGAWLASLAVAALNQSSEIEVLLTVTHRFSTQLQYARDVQAPPGVLRALQRIEQLRDSRLGDGNIQSRYKNIYKQILRIHSLLV